MHYGQNTKPLKSPITGRPKGSRNKVQSAHMKLNPQRRKIFLDSLRETGIFAWAAVAASPHAKTRSGASSSFKALCARDPEFRQQVEEAQAAADAKIEKEAHRRAVSGTPRYVWQRGQLMKDPSGKPAVEMQYSDRLMEVLLRSRLPDRFGERKLKVEHSGRVEHAHGHFVISPDELLALSPEQRQHLRGIVTTLARARGEKIEAAALPAPTESPIVDVDYEDVDQEEDEAEMVELARINS